MMARTVRAAMMQTAQVELDIGQRAIERHRAFANMDDLKLARQLRRGFCTSAGSTIALVVLVCVIFYGPELSEEVSMFVGLLLFVFAALFAVGAFTSIGPIVEAHALNRIRQLKATNDLYDATEESQRLKLIVQEAMDSPEPKSVFAKHADFLSSGIH